MKRLVCAAAFVTSTLASGAANAQSDLKVQILSATIKDQKISGAEVIVQHNGESSTAVKTDGAGAASVKAKVDDGSTVLIVKKEGYSTLVAKCPCDGLTYALSPNMAALDGMRVVLNWGRNPADLDSHLVFPNNHVFFESKKGSDANLDVDDVDSYGPETITLEKKHAGERYVYAVHDYIDRNQPGNTALSKLSDAKVFVYIGTSLVRTYYVPKDQAGNLWVLFWVGENGEFHDVNKMTGVSGDSRAEIRSVLNKAMEGGEYNVAPVIATASQSVAKDLNAKGEKAYHAKKLDDAIALYQQAIDENPEYGQAYSNLGLAFQKAGRTAEAIWANRKAIALATGSTAATVRASSYFNIAKVYEEQKQWADAKKNFESALQNKTNDAYKKGIARMDDELKKAN